MDYKLSAARPTPINSLTSLNQYMVCDTLSGKANDCDYILSSCTAENVKVLTHKTAASFQDRSLNN